MCTISFKQHQRRSDSQNCLRGLKTAHLCANFSESNSFLLPWRSVIIEGVIYNGGVWISAPSLSATPAPGAVRVFARQQACSYDWSLWRDAQVWTCQVWWWTESSGLKGWLFHITHHKFTMINNVSTSVMLHTENKQASTEAARQTHKSWLFTVLSGPRLPVHSFSFSRYNQFFIVSPDGVAPLWCVQDSDWAYKCQCCNS